MGVWRSGYLRCGSASRVLEGGASDPPVWLGGDLSDPVAIEREGRLTLMATRPRAAGGELRVLQFDDGDRLVREGRALRENWAIARPNLVEDDGDLHLLVAPRAGGRPVLHRCAGFPDRWERLGEVLDAPSICPALFRRHGLWWLAYGLREGAGQGGTTLHLAFAPRPTGPWSPHPLNPVASGRMGGPPAGVLVLDDGDIGLPVAGTAAGAGDAVLLRRLGLLTPWEVEIRAETYAPPGALDPARSGFRSLTGGPGVVCFGLDGPSRATSARARRRPGAWLDLASTFAVHP